MIIKGGARGKPNELSAHLLRADTNEKVRLFNMHGVVAGDLKGALAEMSAIAVGSRCTKPLYHVSISPGLTTILSDDQWRETITALEKALGLDGHQRAVVLHTKKDRQHAHIVWNRVDVETLKAAHHGHNYRTHERVARELERRFGLEHVQGVHHEPAAERPKRRSSSRDSQQEGRTGWSRDQAVRDITTAWESSETGAAFAAALNEAGYQLVRGDRKDFVIMDAHGGVHGIARRIENVRAADVRARLADLDPADFPTLEDARRTLATRDSATREGAKDDVQQHHQEHRAQQGAPRSAQAPERYTSLTKREAAPSSAVRATPRAPAPSPRPTWITEAASLPLPSPRPKSTATPSRPARADALSPDLAKRHADERSAQEKRHAQLAKNEMAALANFHHQQLGTLDTHHTRRLSELLHEVEREIISHNGLGSRLRSIHDHARYNQRLAYLVAKREGIQRRELERQEKVRAELEKAQADERAEATRKHAERERLEQEALAKRQERETLSGQVRDRRDRSNDGPGG